MESCGEQAQKALWRRRGRGAGTPTHPRAGTELDSIEVSAVVIASASACNLDFVREIGNDR